MQSIKSFFRLKIFLILIIQLISTLICHSQVINKINIGDENMKSLLTIKEGDVLTPEKSVKIIKALYRTGFYSNVAIFKSENKDSSIDIFIKLTKKIIFTKPKISGKFKIKKKKIYHFLNIFNLKGKEYTESNFIDFLHDFKNYLSEIGFPDAELEYNLKFFNENSEVEPTITIHYGKPIIIGAINSNCKILKKILDLKVGDIFDKKQLNHDIKKSKELLLEENFYKAKFNVESIVKNKVAVVNINVEKGAKFQFNVKGISLTKEDEQKVFKFFKRGDLSKFSLNYIKKNLQHLALLKGFYNPQFTVILNGNKLDCVLKKPIKKKIKKFVFNSKYQFDLKEFNYFNSYSINLIKEKINAFYESKGYFNSNINFDYIEKDKILIINIKENQILRFGKINLIFSPKIKLNIDNTIKENEIYSDKKIDDFIVSLRKTLRENGYYEGEITIKKRKISNFKIPVDISIKIIEPKIIKEIYVYGLKEIQESTVFQFLKIKKGENFVFKDIEKLKDRLFASTYFSEVKIEPFEINKKEVILFIKLKEKNLYSISYGFGGNSDEGVRIFGSVKKSYLFDRNLTGTLFARDSAKKSQLYFSIAGRYGFLSTLYYIYDDKTDYKFSKIGWSTSYAFKYSKGKSLILGVDIKKSNLNNLNVAEEEILKEHFPDYTGKLIARFLLDKRDDILYPRKGYFLDLKLEPSYDFDNSSKYFKFTEKSAFYLGNFAFSQTIGSITSKDSNFTSTPIPERFFIGGANTLRISSFEKAGPLFSNGAPKGGDFLALFSTEYRYKITEEIGGTIFLDIGNVWENSSYANFQSAIKDAGFGFFYKTPLGPIKLELAFNLDKDVFSTGSRLVFSIGHSF